MIAWSGFIGDLVQFILSKIIGKRLDLALDEKKRAAKAFLNLHESLVRLESVTHDFLKETQPIVNGGQARLYRVPFDQIAKDADRSTHLFIESFSELHQAINIYDTALYIMLGEIISVKGALIESSSFMKKMTFHLSPNPNSVFYMQCSLPIKPLTNETLKFPYATAQEVEKKLYSRETEKYFLKIPEWPKDLLLSIVQENFSDQLIADNNIDLIKHLYEMVSKNIPLLSEARKSLGEFLRKNFSLEDILYTKGSK